MNGNAARIYRDGFPTNEPPRPRNVNAKVDDAVDATPAISIRPTAPRAVKPAATVSPSIERAIIDIIGAAPRAGETTELAFRRKEHELGDLFPTLSVIESRTLHRRLSNESASDTVAKAFGRMVADRRARLLAFLADVRRREAIASARRVAP